MESEKLVQWPKSLLSTFRKGFRTDLEEGKFRMEEFGFESVVARPARGGQEELFCRDAGIEENRRFTYPVFIPRERRDDRRAILLLHGLNERNWDKYLVWAEYLALNTGKPVT